GHWVVDPSALQAAGEQLHTKIEAAGAMGLDVATLDDRERGVLTTLEGVVVIGGRVQSAGADDPLADHPFVAQLSASLFSPPSAADLGVDRGELRELVRRGLVIEQDGFHFAPAAIDEATATLSRLLAAKPEGVTVSDVREALGTSRKWAVPLLNALDARGVTRRRADLRVAGPRLG